MRSSRDAFPIVFIANCRRKYRVGEEAYQLIRKIRSPLHVLQVGEVWTVRVSLPEAYYIFCASQAVLPPSRATLARSHIAMNTDLCFQ
jgi:hypothetical protein